MMMDGVSTFLLIAFNFPTVLFTILLMVSVIYWAVAMFGFFEEGVDNAMELSGLLATLGLHGVPLPITITLLSLFSWLSSYGLQWVANSLGVSQRWWSWLAVGVLVISVLVGYLVAVLVARWFRPLFSALNRPPLEHSLEGLNGVVVGLAQDNRRGRARVSHAGVDLTVKVRAAAPLHHGMKVLLIGDERGLFYWVEEIPHR